MFIPIDTLILIGVVAALFLWGYLDPSMKRYRQEKAAKDLELARKIEKAYREKDQQENK